MIEHNKVSINSYHTLKILPKNFTPIIKGIRNFDVRKNDRDFQIGDKILLKEHDGKHFTGREVVGEIRYITDYEQKEDYVVFGFRKYSIKTHKNIDHS